MKSIEMTGKSVEDAIKSALDSLNLTEDKVNIDILEEESKGFLKFFKNKEAKIRVTIKKNPVDDANIFLKDILVAMNILADIEIKEEKNTLKINLVGPNMGVIIGHRGETLDAIQYLVNLAVNKGNEGNHLRVIVDTEDYRSKREETLKLLANRLARKVKKTRRSVKLEPMNPYERRIIHYALQSDKGIVTFSEGEEPYRRVVIDLKKKA
jgi:spoIIIJ-associated protein